jgi:hypothetical protein
MKAIIAAIAFALVPVSALAGGPDPSPEVRQAPSDPRSKEEFLANCFVSAGLKHAETVAEYEEVRYSQPGYFYFGSKIWTSKGTDMSDPDISACLKKVGARPSK